MTKIRHIMQDHRATDPRSVAAQLRGTGDGRGERYLRFQQMMMELQPNLKITTITKAYSARLREEAAVEREKAYRIANLRWRQS